MEPKMKIWVVMAIPDLQECEPTAIAVCHKKPTEAQMKKMLEGWAFEDQRNGGDSKEEAREACELIHEEWEAEAVETWLYE